MMSVNRGSLRAQLLNEIMDEMHELEGKALDEFLSDAGFDPQALLADFEGSVRLFGANEGRRMFEAARTALKSDRAGSNALNLEATRKHSVFLAIKQRMATTGEMTIAARNQRMDSEEDLDRFLEACMGLGIIDENGNLKD
jgi:hypothetical protein